MTHQEGLRVVARAVGDAFVAHLIPHIARGGLTSADIRWTYVSFAQPLSPAAQTVLQRYLRFLLRSRRDCGWLGAVVHCRFVWRRDDDTTSMELVPVASPSLEEEVMHLDSIVTEVLEDDDPSLDDLSTRPNPGVMASAALGLGAASPSPLDIDDDPTAIDPVM